VSMALVCPSAMTDTKVDGVDVADDDATNVLGRSRPSVRNR
jgi:hypothetical protein